MEAKRQKRIRIVYMTTVASTVKAFLRGHLSFLRQNGFDITVISSPGEELTWIEEKEKVTVQGIPMCREISVARDIVSLWRLWRYFRKTTPDMVVVGTPKASLLGMIAAGLNRVPLRIYEVRGLRLETTKGVQRVLLSWMERITSWLAHFLVCDSQSLRRLYVKERLAPSHKISVLGDGSCNGVDRDRFLPTQEQRREAEELRRRHGIDPREFVIGFVGRITRDKGIVDLIHVFTEINQESPFCRLLLIGEEETGDTLPASLRQTIQDHQAILRLGHIEELTPYYSLMNLLVLPSYREGFPSVPLEAALSGVPTLGYRSTGMVDAVIDGETGILVPQGDKKRLQEALEHLLVDRSVCRDLGEKARRRVLDKFEQKDVWQRWLDFYRACLAKQKKGMRAAG